MKKSKKIINYNELPHNKHIKFLIKLEKQAEIAFDFVLDKIINDIKSLLKEEKLSKSDDKLQPGWSIEIPKIELDLAKTVNKISEKYLIALKWILLGDLAGKKATDAAKEIGLTKVMIPGILASSYLQSLDTQRKYYNDLFGKKPEDIHKELIKESINKIKEKSNRTFDPILANIKSVIAETVNRVIADHHLQNISKVHKNAMDDIHAKGSESALNEAIDNIDERINKKTLAKELSKTSESLKNSWNRNVCTELAGTSAIGSHQAMIDIFHRENSDIKIAWITSEDERTCKWCNDISKNATGNWKYYKISDFKPTGWNFGRKKSEWQLTITPGHYNCRCFLVYIPPGYILDQGGNLIKV